MQGKRLAEPLLRWLPPPTIIEAQGCQLSKRASKRSQAHLWRGIKQIFRSEGPRANEHHRESRTWDPASLRVIVSAPETRAAAAHALSAAGFAAHEDHYGAALLLSGKARTCEVRALALIDHHSDTRRPAFLFWPPAANGPLRSFAVPRSMPAVFHYDITTGGSNASSSYRTAAHSSS